MSTRAERRLKEAQEALDTAQAAHRTAATALAAIEEQAIHGDEVAPLELAAAQGDERIKQKRVERAQSAVDTEQATVDEERARAAHRALVDEVKAIPEPAALGDLYAALERVIRESFAASEAWENARSKVRAAYGEIPMTGNPAAALNGDFYVAGAFKLDGVRYTRPDPEKLVRELSERARRAHETVRSERRRSVVAAVPNREQADIDATVEQLREDEARLNAARPAA